MRIIVFRVLLKPILSRFQRYLIPCLNRSLKSRQKDDSAHYVLESELDIIEGEHLKETLLASLEHQARMLPSYVPACHEKALTVSDGILYAGVPLIGRVDRVDVSSDGKNFVVFELQRKHC